MLIISLYRQSHHPPLTPIHNTMSPIRRPTSSRREESPRLNSSQPADFEHEYHLPPLLHPSPPSAPNTKASLTPLLHPPHQLTSTHPSIPASISPIQRATQLPNCPLPNNLHLRTHSSTIQPQQSPSTEPPTTQFTNHEERSANKGIQRVVRQGSPNAESYIKSELYRDTAIT